MLLTKQDIKNIIPYDDPFLWVDEVEKIEGDEIIAYKHTSQDDSYFKGHFIDMPIMPGVLVVEGLAQAGTILLRKKMGQGHERKHLLAYDVKSAFFYKPIWPGDKIKYKVELLGFYANKIANFKAEAIVGDEKKCEARFVVAIVDKDEFKQEKINKTQGNVLANQEVNQRAVQEVQQEASIIKQETTTGTDRVIEPIKEIIATEYVKQTSMPPLRVGNKYARVSIIQGGMAVRVSLHNLAGNVAKCGGVGIIAVSGMSDPEEVKSEIRKAREIAGPEGVIGINIMGVIGHFVELVDAAMEEKIDLIIQGAGFRNDIFEIGKQYNVPIFSIASSVKVALKAEQMGATAVVIEGSDAGGHLGFRKGHEFRKTVDIVKDVVKEIKIPVIAAGGVYDSIDIAEMLRAGAKGVQMATRFVATQECDVDEKFKKAYVNAGKDDVVIITSPVGLPGRAIKTPFVEKILNHTAPKPDPLKCKGCIGPVCDKSYCILEALENARKGDLENGLVFAGSNVWRINKIATVEEIMKELENETNKILAL